MTEVATAADYLSKPGLSFFMPYTMAKDCNGCVLTIACIPLTLIYSDHS